MSPSPSPARHAALAALFVPIFAAAEMPSKTSFVGFGASVEIAPFISECLSISFANFFVGEFADSTRASASQLVPTAGINLFGENTCFGIPFYSSGVVTGPISFTKGPAGNSITASGTIPVFTIGAGAEQVSFEITVVSTGQKANRVWGTSNAAGVGFKSTSTFNEDALPATATLRLSGNIAFSSLLMSTTTGSSIGSQDSQTTILALPK